MKNKPQLLSLLLAAGSLLAAAPAAALDFRPDTASLQLGPGRHGTSSITAGIGWDWAWQRPVWRLLATGQTELFASAWRAHDFGDGHQWFGHFGVLPTVRLRFDEGRSPWFAEAGIGLSWMDRHYITPYKQMSTRFNFVDVIGVGRSFGTGGRHELSLRYTHVSNGGYREPNPGEDFLLLRYATRF